MASNHDHFQSLRQMLLHRRQEIQKQLEKLLVQHRTEQSEFREASVADIEDQSFQNSTAERQIVLMRGWNLMRNNIDSALQRLNDGTYGFCEDCNEPIKLPRLKAQPFARRCLTCQEKTEMFEKVERGWDQEVF